MKLPIVESFLGLMSMETGGTIVGIFSAIWNGLGVLVLGILVLIAFGVTVFSLFADKSGIGAGLGFVLLVVAVLFFAWWTYCLVAAIKLCSAVNSRNHMNVKPFFKAQIVSLVTSCMGFLLGAWMFVVGIQSLNDQKYARGHNINAQVPTISFFLIALDVYLIIFVNSLYKKFKDENLHKSNFPTAITYQVSAGQTFAMPQQYMQIPQNAPGQPQQQFVYAPQNAAGMPQQYMQVPQNAPGQPQQHLNNVYPSNLNAVEKQ